MQCEHTIGRVESTIKEMNRKVGRDHPLTHLYPTCSPIGYRVNSLMAMSLHPHRAVALNAVWKNRHPPTYARVNQGRIQQVIVAKSLLSPPTEQGYVSPLMGNSTSDIDDDKRAYKTQDDE